jgi:hypothetical protein
MKFGINGMCYQHTPHSTSSHFEPADGSDPVQSLLRIVEELWRPEYDNCDPSVAIHLDAATMARYGRFFTPLHFVDSTSPLKGYYRCRKGALAGELPYLQAAMVGRGKSAASSADVVVYNANALNDAEKQYQGRVVQGAFQILTLLCNLDEQPATMAPVAMARNHSALVAPGSPESIGGTPRAVTAEDYLKALLYWRNKVFAALPGETLADAQRANCACHVQYMGLVQVSGDTHAIEPFFAPAVPGGVPFLQYRSPNSAWIPGKGKLRPRSPYELACSHAAYLGMPEGQGLVGVAYPPHPEEYRQAIVTYMNRLHCHADV